ncbi:MAG TPA: helix-turn-helix transcriptional regulator [Thermoanaerobaculia bacterium]
MPERKPPDLGAVLKLLRQARGWRQSHLANVPGVASSLISDYEQGRKPLSRKRLEQFVGFMGFTSEDIEATLAYLDLVRGSEAAPGPGDETAEIRRAIERTAVQAGRIVTQAVRSVMTLLTSEGEAIRARQEASILWTRLQSRKPRERVALVEAGMTFRKWALCEKIAAESIAAAPNRPEEALELAKLAVRIAELAPGHAAWRWRLQGYALAHLSNARRVCNDLPGADEAMARARTLWRDGEQGDPGLLEKAWLPGLEAALRKDQRRFPEALKWIDEALELDRGKLRTQILMTKSRILETLGDPEGSTAVLKQATPFIDPVGEPRLAFGLRFNLLVNLCLLGRAAEAESELPVVRDLARLLNEELDLTRVVWLEGRVAAGVGRTAEAVSALQQVRQVFKDRGLVYDYALASLEQAALLLEQGQATEVRALAKEMLWLFRAQGVHREALAALRLFCEAAAQERATVELARRVVAYLHRAQHDPQLPFEA